MELKCEIVQEFIGTINGIVIKEKSTYESTQFISEVIIEKYKNINTTIIKKYIEAFELVVNKRKIFNSSTFGYQVQHTIRRNDFDLNVASRIHPESFTYLKNFYEELIKIE